MSLKEELTFWQLLSDCDDKTTNTPCKIVIPAMQRDYAQGRKDQSALRERFLSSLKSIIDGSEDKHLDFVYGNIKSINNEYELIPLDGQQRLTTLWLIHVYAALMVIKYGEGVCDNYQHLVEHFTYKTRSSSVQFIESLFKLKDNIKVYKKRNKETLSDFIQRQTWFFQEWKQDPTVQSMLRMLSGGENRANKKEKDELQSEKLDCIEKVFDCNNKKKATALYNKLFEINCHVKFYTLNLDSINQSDDLYIKMNARGEQLSSFENFKADLIEYLQDINDTKQYIEFGNPKYILKKWDVEWSDIFWRTQREVAKSTNDTGNTKLEKKDNIDDVFFVFVKRFLLNRYTETWSNVNNKKLKYAKDPRVLYFQQHENTQYTSFDFFKEVLPKEKAPDILDELTLVLDGLKELHTYICKTKPEGINKWINDNIPMLNHFEFLPSYQLDTDKYSIINTKVKSITFQQRVVFYGICKFLIANKKNSAITIDAEYMTRLKHWLRVLSNLAYYSEIENLEALRIRISNVNELCKKLIFTLDIYRNSGYIKTDSKQKDFNDQWELEKKKNSLINNNTNIESDLMNLDSLWIFRGCTGCLLNDEHSALNVYYDKLKEVVGESYAKPGENEDIRRFFLALLSKFKEPEGAFELLFNDNHGNMRKQLNGTLKAALLGILDDGKKISGIVSDTCGKSMFNDWRYIFFDPQPEYQPAPSNPGIWTKTKSGKIVKCKDDNGSYKYVLYHSTRKSTWDEELNKKNVPQPST